MRRRDGRSLQQFLGRYRLQADDGRVVFIGQAGHFAVAEGTGAQTVAVLDEGLWMQLAEQASAVHDEDSP